MSFGPTDGSGPLRQFQDVKAPGLHDFIGSHGTLPPYQDMGTLAGSRRSLDRVLIRMRIRLIEVTGAQREHTVRSDGLRRLAAWGHRTLKVHPNKNNSCAARQDRVQPGMHMPGKAGMEGRLVKAGIEAALGRLVGRGVTGVSACVAARTGERIAAARGTANLETGEELTTGHLFRIASITKTFVFALVLQLHEEGSLDIEAPVARWLPDLPYARDLTLRHVLTQTGGLPTYSHDALDEFPPSNSIWKPSDLIALAYRMTPPTPPGGPVVYANVGSKVAAAIAEIASDEPLPDAIRRRFLNPLGLDRVVPSGSGLPPPPELAEGYHFLPGASTPTPATRRAPVSFLWGSGDMYADPASLTAWALALYGGRVLSKSLTSELLRFALPGSIPGSTMSHHGLGVMFFERGGICIPGHRGSTPGYAGIFGYYPDTRTAICVQANSHAAHPASVHRAGVEDAFFEIVAAI